MRWEHRSRAPFDSKKSPAVRAPFCGPNPGLRAYCHPKNYPPLPNSLYRNNGDGTFTDVSAAMGIDKFYGKGMGVAFADYDHDGFMDVFVANDNAPNQLFHNLGGRKFDEVALDWLAWLDCSATVSASDTTTTSCLVPSTWRIYNDS